MIWQSVNHTSTKFLIGVRKFTAWIGIFFQSIANMNSMEKRLRVKRCSPFLSRESQDEAPFIIIHPADSELAAKDMLFDLSDNQDHPTEEKTFKVSQWFNAPDEPLEESPLTSVKVLPAQHKSLYFTRKTQAKVRTQTSQQHHLQFSVIPYLKSHLRKLESPDKQQPAEKRKEGKIQKTTAPDENFETYLLQMGLSTPKTVYRPKNASLYKKTKKSFVMHGLDEDKGRNLLSRQKTCCDIRDIGERLEVIKEARRNRTLRKLLL